LWWQNSSGVLGNVESDDRFGEALGVGDFDNDGFDDLAIGAPGEDTGGRNADGSVNVLFGSTTGLTATGDQLWGQNSPGVLGGAESNDRFGAALGVGDFNSDGFDDLAIGAPGEDTDGRNAAGGVNVLFGSAAGLTATGDQFWGQNSPGVLGGAENFDFFGDVLTVGDFDDDGFDDLAIGAPGEDIGAIANAGATTVLFGSAAGLTAADDQLWNQDSPNIRGIAETDDLFGFVLT
jgi:hypothetical protein